MGLWLISVEWPAKGVSYKRFQQLSLKLLNIIKRELFLKERCSLMFVNNKCCASHTDSFHCFRENLPRIPYPLKRSIFLNEPVQQRRVFLQVMKIEFSPGYYKVQVTLTFISTVLLWRKARVRERAMREPFKQPISHCSIP